jgi:hypothetical protein
MGGYIGIMNQEWDSTWPSVSQCFNNARLYCVEQPSIL